MSDSFNHLLGTAAKTGDTLILAKLLRRVPNLDINVRLTGPYGHTALSVAAKAGHSGVVEMLLDAGAKPNLHDAVLVAPLHLAARANHVDVVKLLLCNGADPNLKTINGLTAIDLTEYNSPCWELIYNFIKHGHVPNLQRRSIDVVPVIPQFTIPKQPPTEPDKNKNKNKKKDKLKSLK